MIRAIGTDLVLVSRIEAVLGRQGERFARRILTATEFTIVKAVMLFMVSTRSGVSFLPQAQIAPIPAFRLWLKPFWLTLTPI